MAIFDRASNSGGSLLEPGRYQLELVRVEPADEGLYGASVKWVFHVYDRTSPDEPRLNADGTPYAFWVFTTVRMTPKARARQYSEALLGRAVADGESIDERALIGRRMEAFVVHAEGQDGRPRARIATEVPVRPCPPDDRSDGRSERQSAGAAAPPSDEPEPLPF